MQPKLVLREKRPRAGRSQTGLHRLLAGRQLKEEQGSEGKQQGVKLGSGNCPALPGALIHRQKAAVPLHRVFTTAKLSLLAAGEPLPEKHQGPLRYASAQRRKPTPDAWPCAKALTANVLPKPRSATFW